LFAIQQTGVARHHTCGDRPRRDRSITWHWVHRSSQWWRRNTHADISKATELIGYELSRDIRKSVSEFIKWYEPLVGS